MYRIVCTKEVANDTRGDHRRAVMASGFRDHSGAIATAANWVERHYPGALYDTGVWHIQPLSLFVRVEKEHPSGANAGASASLPAMT